MDKAIVLAALILAATYVGYGQFRAYRAESAPLRVVYVERYGDKDREIGELRSQVAAVSAFNDACQSGHPQR